MRYHATCKYICNESNKTDDTDLIFRSWSIGNYLKVGIKELCEYLASVVWYEYLEGYRKSDNLQTDQKPKIQIERISDNKQGSDYYCIIIVTTYNSIEQPRDFGTSKWLFSNNKICFQRKRCKRNHLKSPVRTQKHRCCLWLPPEKEGRKFYQADHQKRKNNIRHLKI